MKPFIFLLLFSVTIQTAQNKQNNSKSPHIITYTANPKTQDIRMFWKDDKGQIFKSFDILNSWLNGKHHKLVFAMNGGMYMQNYAPLGVYVQDGKTLAHLNMRKASGNFYMQPNGVFYISKDKEAGVCKTSDFGSVMLVVEGTINSAFAAGSKNLNIRNGVGILPNNEVIFAISKVGINFYDFAKYFKDKGCKNALFLDGFVSRMYLPEKGLMDTEGDFGVMIGVTTSN